MSPSVERASGTNFSLVVPCRNEEQVSPVTAIRLIGLPNNPANWVLIDSDLIHNFSGIFICDPRNHEPLPNSTPALLFFRWHHT